MEYGNFFQHILPYLPENDLKSNTNFQKYLNLIQETVLTELSDFLMVLVPDRHHKYSHLSFLDARAAITGHMNQLLSDLGFYPFRMELSVLRSMEESGQTILMISLVFEMIVTLFVAMSTMLVFSLLKLNIESKSFSIAVMQMTGLSHSTLTRLILI